MADTLCPFETFPSLALPNIRAAFIQRAPHVDVLADRQVALDRLKSIHLSTMQKAGFVDMPLAQADQVHSAHVRIVTKGTPYPVPDCDALVTTEANLCLGIYVADCAAVYLVDKHARGIALAHSGRKGTELGIVTQTIETLCKTITAIPSDIIMQISPCIRPPHYEIDFATDIRDQALAAGLTEIHDCGRCTATNPDLYYSYRRENGRTGRHLALIAITTPPL